ncbi:MAG: hypothetical protein KBC95_01080 [Candidatus Peribacteraceae bacterium]|nr:hypothetical protein [Candidatus Peribacteraceae bacterium]
MPSLRTLAAAVACALVLSACRAAIAPPYNDAPREPTARSSSSKQYSSKTKKSAAKSSSKPAEAATGWTGSCDSQGTCDRSDRVCAAEGTLCVFADAGPVGSCFTLEQRKHCLPGR